MQFVWLIGILLIHTVSYTGFSSITTTFFSMKSQLPGGFPALPLPALTVAALTVAEAASPPTTYRSIASLHLQELNL
jgi:hypothetical protein